ncbi:hypothetical protein V6N13_029724 [Hibiscus sabdariffa]|uniref:Uncharacterized protein n=1 Tax=Hibiscus sabdariffa TaxID=183260 RepID=A0ABR2TA08_9ROSI
MLQLHERSGLPALKEDSRVSRKAKDHNHELDNLHASYSIECVHFVSVMANVAMDQSRSASILLEFQQQNRVPADGSVVGKISYANMAAPNPSDTGKSSASCNNGPSELDVFTKNCF